MGRSPEALHIYFSGPAPRRVLESPRLGTRDRQTIEAAIASARTPNPDLELLRRAEAIILGLDQRAEEEAIPPKHTTGSQERTLASLSGDFNPREELEPDRHSLFGRYLRWQRRRYLWRTYIAPLVVLGLILLAYLLVTRVPGVKEHLQVSDTLPIPANSARYEEAVQRCRRVGKHLPRTVDELEKRLTTIPNYKAETGYWLADGRIYLPAQRDTRPRDNGFHWIVCVED